MFIKYITQKHLQLREGSWISLWDKKIEPDVPLDSSKSPFNYSSPPKDAGWWYDLSTEGRIGLARKAFQHTVIETKKNHIIYPDAASQNWLFDFECCKKVCSKVYNFPYESIPRILTNDGGYSILPQTDKKFFSTPRASNGLNRLSWESFRWYFPSPQYQIVRGVHIWSTKIVTKNPPISYLRKTVRLLPFSTGKKSEDF